ncbi:MAG: hypothetical protein J6N49_05455 [Alphaproteobacteria bacterium]|nr:hypothetical protein [Alphaproteobacteria bacterium]
MKEMLLLIAVVVLTGLIMYLIKKLVETIINLITLYKARKDPNHPARISSSGIVLNKKTKKLEACGDKIILPFD